LLPVGARSCQLVAKFRDQIMEFCATPIADFEKISLCLDKKRTCDLARSIGIKVPENYDVHLSPDGSYDLGDIRFPVIVKGSHEIFKYKPSIARNRKELESILDKWADDESMRSYPPLVQEFIDGNGYGFFALYKNGKLIQSFMHRRIREYPPNGGPSTCAMSVFDERLISLGKKLLDEIEWHGVAMVEFRRETVTGEYYLMEINPKFWGSLDLAIFCGVNFPLMAVNMALGIDVRPMEDYPVGVKFHWPFDGELRHAIERPSSIPEIFRDSLDPAVGSNLWLRDPLPGVLSFAEEMYRTVMALRERKR